MHVHDLWIIMYSVIVLSDVVCGSQQTPVCVCACVRVCVCACMCVCVRDIHRGERIQWNLESTSPQGALYRRRLERKQLSHDCCHC